MIYKRRAPSIRSVINHVLGCPFFLSFSFSLSLILIISLLFSLLHSHYLFLAHSSSLFFSLLSISYFYICLSRAHTCFSFTHISSLTTVWCSFSIMALNCIHVYSTSAGPFSYHFSLASIRLAKLYENHGVEWLKTSREHYPEVCVYMLYI